ncbi:PLDc N-terminal domain-containing protein [Streptococcus merionis]|uniref:Negative regulatory protein yxlE n=1 Tax=Streptococcus merionis TaxID=400065 RepID=A0A239SW39_9STRE|nr:PLD nuclease N-terminal domain-containing protein [Streptococcus merionis]SNU88803.1 Negative regulatory protein yxlE [Streptococcus merionis]
MNTFERVKEYLPFLVPLFLLQLILAIVAVIHILRHSHYRYGNKVFWLIIVIFGQLVGPILYFLIGKGDD